MTLDGRTLANVVEHQLAIPNRPCPVSHREWLYALDNPPVHEHFAPSRYLKKEDLALVSGSVAVGKLLDEKNAAVLVKLNLPIHEVGN